MALNQLPDFSFKGGIDSSIVQAYQRKAEAEQQMRLQAEQQKQDKINQVAQVFQQGAALASNLVEQSKMKQQTQARQSFAELIAKNQTESKFGPTPGFEDQAKASFLNAYPQTGEKLMGESIFAEKPIPKPANVIGPVVGKQLGLPPETTIDQAKIYMESLKTQNEPPKAKPATSAQSAVDRSFAQEYTKYIAAGGFADTMQQIDTLSGVLNQLETGNENLTGVVQGNMPSMLRKVVASKGVEAQQAVEQSVQRTLKATLGGQFTEREGTLFMQRGYDPALSEKANAKKLKRAVNQLKTMAVAKQQAVDYYEENGTLVGYKGKLYTLKNGSMIETTKADFYKMMTPQGDAPAVSFNPNAIDAELKRRGLVK